FGVGPTLLGERPVIEDQLALAMEPVGRPIGRHIAAVTPYRAHLHSTERLPHGLTALDGSLGSNHLAFAGDDSFWDGRHLLIDAAAQPAQDSEPESHGNCQYDPESRHARLLSV